MDPSLGMRESTRAPPAFLPTREGVPKRNDIALAGSGVGVKHPLIGSDLGEASRPAEGNPGIRSLLAGSAPGVWWRLVGGTNEAFRFGLGSRFPAIVCWKFSGL
jgi:hypothetical protein